MLRDFYKCKLYSGGTSTHNAERCVKLANVCKNEKQDESLTSEYAVCGWQQSKEIAKLAADNHLNNGLTKARKNTFKKNEGMRYKSLGMGIIESVNNINDEDIMMGKEYLRYLDNHEYSFKGKRNEKTLTKFTSVFT